MRPLPGSVIEEGGAMQSNHSEAVVVKSSTSHNKPPGTMDDRGEHASQPQLELIRSIAQKQEELKDMVMKQHEEILSALGSSPKKNVWPGSDIAKGDEPELPVDAAAVTVSNSIQAKKNRISLSHKNGLDELRAEASAPDVATLIPSWKKRQWSRSMDEAGRVTRLRIYLDIVMQLRGFEITIASLILLNALWFAVQMDMAVRDPGAEPPTFVRVVQIFFTVVFTLEIGLRIFVEGGSFLARKNPLLAWNLFDSFLVLMSLVEEVFGSLKSLPNVLAIRILRILRLMRVLRAFRVLRFFRDLRVMVRGIHCSIKSLVWAMMLLFLVMFAFSLVIMHFIAEELTHDNIDPSHRDELEKYFGTFLNSQYTLFGAISGGDDWLRFMYPLREIHDLLALIFCGYIAFATFCVLNIVTGVFVDNATKMLDQDEDELLVSEIESRQQQLDDIRKLFEANDNDHSNDLDIDEFKHHMKDPRVKYALRRIGLDLDTVTSENLFFMLDFDQSGTISMDEFVLGIQMFHGDARSIDVAKVRYDLGVVKELLKDLIGEPHESVKRTTVNPGTKHSVFASDIKKSVFDSDRSGDS